MYQLAIDHAIWHRKVVRFYEHGLRKMLKNKSIALLLAVILALLNGCTTTPETISTYKFDSKTISNRTSNSIITSVASKDILNKLEIPSNAFMGWNNTYPPATINGEPSSQFSKTFAGIPIDGNFQVEISSGVQKLGFYHVNGNYETREYLIEFNSQAGHKYYTKFFTPIDYNSNKYRVIPIVYDITTNKKVEYKFISDFIINQANR